MGHGELVGHVGHARLGLSGEVWPCGHIEVATWMRMHAGRTGRAKTRIRGSTKKSAASKGSTNK